MRISDVSSSVEGGRLTHSATVLWEENQRVADRLWFKIDGAESEQSLDLNALLIGLFPLAVLNGERRISLPGPVSPYLIDRLIDLHGWWQTWGFANQVMPVIEATKAENVSGEQKNTWTSVGFLSGGVDSLHMLERNLKTFPKGGMHRITDCILVTGLDVDMNETDEHAAYELANSLLTKISTATGVNLIRAETNLRKIEPSLNFWLKQWHIAALSSVAHAAIKGRGVLRVAGAYDIPNVIPWGSHPVVDPIFSTERLSIIHEAVTFTRLQKVRDLKERWPLAFQSMRVCTTMIPDFANCGLCEKCVRTKLEIAAIGAEIPESFANRELDSSQLPQFTNKYQVCCYRDVIKPLRAAGHTRIARAIELKLLSAPLINFAKKLDKEYASGNALKLFRKIKPSAWTKSRIRLNERKLKEQ